MENLQQTDAPIPDNEHFMVMVKDYYNRFPSFGSPIAMAMYLKDTYKEVGVDVSEQLKYFIKNTK